MKKYLISFGILGLSSLGFATELVTNGNFEALPTGTGWTESSTGNFVIIGDWSTVVVASGGDMGPSTNTAWLGGYDDAIDTVTQSISTVTGATSAFLDFDYYFTDEDFAGFDGFTVTLGANQVYSFDPGFADDPFGTLSGVVHQHIDVLSLMDGSSKNLVFGIATDSSLPSSIFVDNVSLNVTTSSVPEPASFAVLGLGAVALIRRRKRA